MDRIGIDLGAGNIKLVGDKGTALLPSYVTYQEGRTYRANLAQRKQDEALAVQSQGSRAVFVGINAPGSGRPVENLDEARFAQGSPELRALLYGALFHYGIEAPRDINVMLGLPQGAWEASREDPDKGLATWLLGRHEWTANGKSCKCRVVDFGAVSQPIGALYDYILGEDGLPVDERAGQCWGQEVAVVSIGYSTLELHTVTLEEEPIVSDWLTTSETVGVRRLLRMTDPEGRFRLADLDRKLRNGTLNVAPVLDLWGAEVVGRIEARWDDVWQRFAQVIVVGGGSILLRDHLLGFFDGKAWFAQQPIMAVAQGLYKFMLMREHAEAEE